MLVSLCLDPGRTWADTLAVARGAEAAGVASLFTCDHFMPHDAEDRPVGGPVLEGWCVLSALAVATSDAVLGTLVLGATYRPAGVVSAMAGTLAQLCGGRLLLGLGAGWQQNEHLAYGIDLPAPGPRLRAFEAYVADVRAGLGTTPVPLLVGGGGEQHTMRVAARHADAWHVWGPADRFAAKSAVMDVRCAEIDREPSSLRRLSGEGIDPGTPDAEVRSLLVGYRAAGCDELVLRDHREVPVEASVATVRQALSLL